LEINPKYQFTIYGAFFIPFVVGYGALMMIKLVSSFRKKADA